jgi:hypothetical protein
MFFCSNHFKVFFTYWYEARSSQKIVSSFLRCFSMNYTKFGRHFVIYSVPMKGEHQLWRSLANPKLLAQICQQFSVLRRQECFQRRRNWQEFSRNFLELGWSVLRNFYSFFVDDIVFFFKIRRTIECEMLFFLFCNQPHVVLQFLASLRIVNYFTVFDGGF